MSRNVALPRIGKFGTDTAQELALFEQSIQTKLRKDDDQEHGPFAITDTVRSTYTAKPWDIVMCDATDGAFSVLLPDPSTPLARGAWIGVKNNSDSLVALTVQPIAGLLDGQPSSRIREPRFFQWFFSDGREWKRGPSHAQYVHPRITTHIADANTVALWQGDPPNNNGNGLLDSSGHGLTLAMGAGTERYGPLGYGQEGFLLDGSNYWQRAGAANDAALNLVGNSTVEYLIRLLVQPPGRANATTLTGGAVVTYGAVGETGGNDNVLWASWAENANAFGPNVAGVFGTTWFWETGAGVNQAIEDQALVSMYEPHHVAIVRSAAGGTVSTYIDGFLQSVTTGLSVGTVGGAPTQFVRIGADNNAAQFLSAIVGSVKVSNVARSAEYIYADAARCLGHLHVGVV